MKSSFNLLDILGTGKKGKKEEKPFVIDYIDIDLIDRSEKNFYSIEEIEELKETIKLYGLQQNLVVRKKPDDERYELISGERRFTALKSLIAEGREELRIIPTKVEYEIDDVKAELLLILTNSTARTLSDYEKVQQATKLKELLQELKKRGVKLPGRLRDIVAGTLDISATQVGRIDSINNNLAPEFKEELKEGNINFSTASELATLSKEKQNEVYEEFKEKGNIEIKDVKRAKKSKWNEGRKCPIDGADCDHGGIIAKNFIKQGNILGCAGCCKICWESELNKCTHVCSRFKNYLWDNAEKESEESETKYPVCRKGNGVCENAPSCNVCENAPNCKFPDCDCAGEAEQEQETEAVPTQEAVEAVAETRRIDECICVYCGYIFSGRNAVNANLDCIVIKCPTCDGIMNVFMSVEYTCTPIEQYSNVLP